ncbi:MAG TPA: alpha/beta hydrolase-fold protein [Allosphingosinicella sp.]|nr:alpha/beta hydrolase-fold protein [Allosphingosinicella sp.]
MLSCPRLFLVLLAMIAPAATAAGQAPPGGVEPAGGRVQPLVIGEIHTLASRVMGADRRILVRLPGGYASEPQRRYDVVYVIDGGPEQDFPHLAGLAQSAEVNGTFAPLILVGIETVRRRSEITPPASDVAAYEAELGATPGGSAQFRRFIAEEIKPWVEARFRTSGNDAVIGESLAGLFVIEALFEQPDLFDDYIAVTPSLWWENMKYGREAGAYLRRLPARPRRLYLTLADEGYLHEEGVNLLVAALEAAAPDHLQWLYLPQGDSETHAGIYHGAALDAFRAFYGLPARIYLPGPLLSGRPLRARTPEEQARRDRACTRENARRTTPAATRTGHDAIAYECLLYDLGPRAPTGRFDR